MSVNFLNSFLNCSLCAFEKMLFTIVSKNGRIPSLVICFLRASLLPSFKDSKNIVIPNTVKKIGHNAFGFQDNLTITMPTSIEYLDCILWNCHDITVIYQGTLAQWKEITIRGNSSKNATIICTDGETTAAL